ncbi:MAG: GNAT family N-acetyltransferase [Xanthomonadales bacterium]|nr:GNAT family N-acetyltransferase [Xanthomonadales bacterium]
MTDELAIEVLRGAAIRPWLNEVARLRIAVFREWPYLYDGDEGYEARYLEAYARSDDGVLVLVRAGGRVVGASTGLPLEDETEPFQAPFRAAGIPPGSVFYCGESVLDPRYRGRGIYRQLFAAREAHARALGRFEWIAFAAVERDPEDPRRPPDHRPLEPFWRRLGYEKRPELRMRLGWKEVSRPGEQENTLAFWLRRL